MCDLKLWLDLLARTISAGNFSHLTDITFGHGNYFCQLNVNGNNDTSEQMFQRHLLDPPSFFFLSYSRQKLSLPLGSRMVNTWSRSAMSVNEKEKKPFFVVAIEMLG